MAHIVHRAFVYTLRLGKKSVSHVYIAMYGQQSPALEVKQCVSDLGKPRTRTSHHDFLYHGQPVHAELGFLAVLGGCCFCLLPRHHQLVAVGQEHSERPSRRYPGPGDAFEQRDAQLVGPRNARVARTRFPGSDAFCFCFRGFVTAVDGTVHRRHRGQRVNRAFNPILVEPVPAPRACEVHVVFAVIFLNCFLGVDRGFVEQRVRQGYFVLCGACKR